MKKSLVALAVAAALPAFAQAQTSIQLIGSVDVAVESLNKDANGGKADLQVNDGVWGGSRVAIVGSEELGSGLKAIFNIEHRFRADTGAQTNPDSFWHGQSWVGLDGGFGTVKLGRQLTPMDAVLNLGDVTGQSWYYSADGLGMATRVSNAISYATPSLGGLTLAVAYAAGEQDATAGATSDWQKLGDTVAVGALGNWGVFSLGLSYQSVDGAKINNIKRTDQAAVSAGLKLGAFGAGLVYAQTDEKHEVGSNSKDKGFHASLSYAVTDAGTVYLTYLRNDPEGNDNITNGIGLTYSHALSKRTYVYAAAGIGKEEQGPGADDNKPRRFALGMRHFF